MRALTKAASFNVCTCASTDGAAVKPASHAMGVKPEALSPDISSSPTRSTEPSGRRQVPASTTMNETSSHAWVPSR